MPDTDDQRFHLALIKLAPLSGQIACQSPWPPVLWTKEFLDGIYATVIPVIEKTGFYDMAKFGSFQVSLRFVCRAEMDDEYEFKRWKQDGVKILTIGKKLCWEENADNSLEEWRDLLLRSVGQTLIQVCKKFELNVEPVHRLVEAIELDEQARVQEREDTLVGLELHLKLSNEQFGGETERMGFASLSDRIEAALEKSSLGLLEGEEVGGGFFSLFVRGENSRRILDEIRLLLGNVIDIQPGSYAVLKSGDKDERVNL